MSHYKQVCPCSVMIPLQVSELVEQNDLQKAESEQRKVELKEVNDLVPELKDRIQDLESQMEEVPVLHRTIQELQDEASELEHLKLTVEELQIQGETKVYK